MFRISTSQALFATALTFAACAPRATSFDPPPPEEATIVVQNDNASEIELFAVEGNSRWRLGTVHTGSIVTLRIPRTLTDRSTIQLQALLPGRSSQFTFQRVPVSLGARLQLKVASVLSMSALTW